MEIMFLFPRLNDKQIEKISDISSNIGLVALGSVALPAILDRFNAVLVILGLAIAIGFWIVSIWLRR